jgi:glycosyltransferase involved in cell wall biosynthesis
MDIILVPSSGEAFGIVFLEAFAAGVSVVAFDIPAGNEIIKDGFSGLLATPGSVHSLAEKINELYKNKGLYMQIREQAFAGLKERFSLSRMVAGYQDFYEIVLSKYSKAVH